MNSYYLSTQSKETAASVALGRSLNLNKRGSKYKLPILLQARECQTSKDYECAINNWNDLLSINENSIQAIVNISLIKVIQNNFLAVGASVLRAQELSKTYQPLKELQNLNENSN